jgi:hypothetical protein
MKTNLPTDSIEGLPATAGSPIAMLAAALLDSKQVMVIGDGCSTRARDLWVLTDIIGKHLEPKRPPVCQQCRGDGLEEIQSGPYFRKCPTCNGTGLGNV